MDATIAQFIFISYFSVIIFLLAVILKSIPWSQAKLYHGVRRKAVLFSSLTLGSFAHTWYYMFKFLARSFQDYETQKSVSQALDKASLSERITAWLIDSTLFEQAWATVCAGPLNWWWSEQICAYTVGAWTVFLFVEGQRYKVKHIWAYMLLGQLVAISVASNLFYLALSLSSYTPGPNEITLRAKPILWLSILISLLTVANTPYTTEQTFLPNLLIMHAMLTVPLFYVSFRKYSFDSTGRFSIHFRTLHFIIFLFTSLMRARTIITAFQAVPYYTEPSVADLYSLLNLRPLLHALWETLHSHPAQSSIGWDAVWTSGSFVVWTLRDSLFKLDLVATMLVHTALFSAGTVASFLELSKGKGRKERAGPAATVKKEE
ncbi:hypothetical protein D9758_009530 [Tetrapyrgos nigripes]|uniref:Uncharacterized protein n=1 Tax=Tetrapyrgos nigripes TaxID=182062 RepID=A0A8H5G144_9AGAR|nr:hypothetical protein D9758_009530 [Tetrapyrgos nigripes]